MNLPPILHPDGSRSWGYIADNLRNRRSQRPAHELLLTKPRVTAVPRTYSLAGFNGSCIDQGSYGECTGCGTAQGVYTSLAARGKPLGFMPSQRTTYTIVRCLERTTDPKTKKPAALTDSGAMPTDLITVLGSFGVCPMGPMADDGRYNDVDATNINAEPDLLQLEMAAQKLEVGAYRIDETAPNAISQIQACVTEGITVGIGFFCDSNFQGWNPSKGPLDVVDMNDPEGGGHWVFFDAYDTSTNGVVILGGMNSWGRSFGSGGRFEVTSNWFEKAVSDCIPFAINL